MRNFQYTHIRIYREADVSFNAVFWILTKIPYARVMVWIDRPVIIKLLSFGLAKGRTEKLMSKDKKQMAKPIAVRI